MSQDDVFDYQDFGSIHEEGHAFRLLRLVSGDGTELYCHLFKAYVNKQPEDDVLIPYEALSYVWGECKATKRITLNSKNHWITANLYEALLNLRRKSIDRIIWVDALCINQEYNEEKNHQIRHIAAIYQQAECVIFWLGPSTLETSLLLSALKQLHHESSKLAYRNWSITDNRWSNLWSNIVPDPSMHPQYWKGLRDLLDRPYFTRVWIIQECAHAKTGIVACGRKAVPAHIFALAPHLLDTTPVAQCQAVLDILPGSPRHGWWKERRELFVLLEKFQGSAASDPRDKIYALLSMATDAKGFPDPNYNLPFEQVIEQTIQFLFPCQWANDFPTYSSFSQFVRNLKSLNNKAFLLAAEQGNTALLPIIASRPGFYVNSLDKSGCNALSLAAEHGETGAIEYLLTIPHINKNLCDQDNRTPLLRAVQNFDTAACTALLNDDQVDEGSISLDFQTPLRLAAETKQKLVAQRIVQRICQRVHLQQKHRAWEMIYLAIKFDDLEFIKAFINKYGFRAMVMPCPDFVAKDIYQLGQWFLTTLQKFNCLNLADAEGSRLLTWAIEHGLTPLVIQLMDSPTLDVDFYDQQGETPLTQAIKKNRLAIIELLVNGRHGLHNILVMKANNEGQRPLGIAVRENKIAVARLLIQAKEMEINANCELGIFSLTPLEKAIDLGRIDMMKTILSIQGVKTQWAFDILSRKRLQDNKASQMHDMLKEYVKSFPVTDL